VLEWAPRAGERAAASGAHREAAAQYARALAHADALAPDIRAGLLKARIEECRLCAQFDDAIEAQREALDLHRRVGNRLAEGDGLRSLSRLLFFAARIQDGERAGRDAIALLEQLPAGRELAMAYANFSQRRMVVEEYDEAIAWGNRALDLARELGDDEVTVYALTNIGAAELDAGDPGGTSTLERALSLADGLGLEDNVGRAFALLVIYGVRTRRFDLADRHLAPGLAYCTERGLDTPRGYLLAHRAAIQLHRGDWDGAGESAGVVLRDPRSPPVGRVWALAALGRLRARRGDPDASVPLDEAVPLVETTGELMQIGPVATARAELAWLSGDGATVQRATDGPLALAVSRRSGWIAGELAYWRWQIRPARRVAG
jgi:tetratricopeptide (TPR) repeat protein